MWDTNHAQMRYIAAAPSRRVEWLRQALRQILFVFVPMTVLAVYTLDFHNTPYEHMYQEDMVLVALFIGAPVGLALWASYRIVRFAIGR